MLQIKKLAMKNPVQYPAIDLAVGDMVKYKKSHYIVNHIHDKVFYAYNVKTRMCRNFSRFGLVLLVEKNAGFRAWATWAKEMTAALKRLGIDMKVTKSEFGEYYFWGYSPGEVADMVAGV